MALFSQASKTVQGGYEQNINETRTVFLVCKNRVLVKTE